MKMQLDRAGIEYTPVDVTEDPSSADYLRSKGLRKLPVLELDGAVLRGYTELSKILKDRENA